MICKLPERYAYPVGTIVTIGGGPPVKAPVTRQIGPYTIEVGGRLICSVTLVTDAEPAHPASSEPATVGDDRERMEPDSEKDIVAGEPGSPDNSDQLSLF